MDSRERGMNPVAMIIMNLCKEYRLSSRWPMLPKQIKCGTWIDICLERVENIVWKGENAANQHFFHVPQCFKRLYLLDRFNPFPNSPWFLPVCSTSLLKTLWKKEKFLVTSNFSLSLSVFYPFGELSAIFIKLEIVICKPFQFGRV